jgi:hypothetical protein
MRPSTSACHRSILTVLALAVGVSGGAVVGATGPAPQPGDDADGPAIDVPVAELRGNAAIAFVEATDVELAPSQPNEVILDELATDPLLFVGADGMVGYSEPAVGNTADGDIGNGAVATGDALPGGTDVFTLHSRPTSSRTLFLDVDGHTTTGQWWNTQYGVEPIASGAYDIDGNPGSFSATEQQRIHDIWQIVSDDFAPFDVDVTTEDPGSAALRRSSSGDAEYGQRVVITSTDWYYASRGVRIGGIALIDVFSSSVDYSSFVFAGNLGGGATKYTAEAASHEAGHTFGLLHDGTGSVGYYAGHGDWAPIMGVGYYEPITQWSKGEYNGANNQEDDLANILQHVPEVTDDHADTPAGATAVGAASTTTALLAVDDTDVFTVAVGDGPLQVTIDPSGMNLHAKVTLATGDGDVLDTVSPTTATGFTVSADAVVAAGTYRITVEEVGWLAAATGFTDYASMGAYELTVAGTEPIASAPTTSSSTTTTTVPTPKAGDRRAGFSAMKPKRIVDTRTALGGSRRLAAGRTLTVQIRGRHRIPFTATAAVVNVTAVGPAAAGRLAVVPCTSGTPSTTTVQYAARQVVANTTIATLDSRGRFCVWTSAASDVLVDVTGWLAPGAGAGLTPVGPTRLADTRTGLGGSRRLIGNRTMVLDVRSGAAGSSAVALNVSVVGPAAPGYVTVYPCGTTRPSTSTINHVAGEVRANNTVVGIGGGKVCIYSLVATDIVVDLVGRFGSTGLRYLPTTPRRIVDTRSAGGRLATGTAREYGVGSTSAGTVKAASVTVTAIGHRSDGYTTTYACGRLPTASTVNHLARQPVSNGAIARTTTRSTSCAYSSAGGHLLIDLSGWWV